MMLRFARPSTTVARGATLATAVAAVAGVAVTAAGPPAVARPEPAERTSALKVLRRMDLGIPLSGATAINARGQVIGVASEEVRSFPFFWDRGRTTEIGHLGGGDTRAADLSDSGLVTGVSYLPDAYSFHAFLWQNGRIRDLGTLGGSYSIGAAVNSAGQVAGQATDATGRMRPVLWQDGRAIDLKTSPDYSGEALDLNERGQVLVQESPIRLVPPPPGPTTPPPPGPSTPPSTGPSASPTGTPTSSLSTPPPTSPTSPPSSPAPSTTLPIPPLPTRYSAFVYERGTRVPLQPLIPGGRLEATRIAENGDVVGFSWQENGEARAVVWRNGVPRILPGDRVRSIDINARGDVLLAGDPAILARRGQLIPVRGPAGSFAYPRALNAGGIVVGDAYQGDESRAFAWRSGQVVPLLGPDSQATDVNDRGQVAGSTRFPDGDTRAVIWQLG